MDHFVYAQNQKEYEAFRSLREVLTSGANNNLFGINQQPTNVEQNVKDVTQNGPKFQKVVTVGKNGIETKYVASGVKLTKKRKHGG